MKKILTLLLSFMLIAGLAACAGQPEPEATVGVDWDFFNERAKAFVTAAANGDFDAAHAMLDETMAGLADTDALQALWDEAITATGAFVAIHDIENAEADGHYISGVIVRHEDSGYGWNIVFSGDGLIAGLFAGGAMPLPSDVENEQTAGESTQREGFTDYPIIIGEGTVFPLDGILSMPDGVTAPVPAVVIVHGSGPHDMDASMVGSPYRDIAEFLAANGIAVVRYDKRTYTHGMQMVQAFGGSATVWEETIEDAIFAAELLRADSRIDENRVFMIGHSLGGLLAPRIHTSGGDFAGLILLATSPRPVMSVILIEQLTESLISGYEAGQIDSETLTEQLADMEALVELFASIENMTDEEAKETLVFGASAYYIRDLESPTFAEHVSGVTIPIFVMHAGRDFQTPTDPDFYLFQEILAGRDNVTLKLYEDLNHSFMPSTATSFVEHASEIMAGVGSVYAPALQDIVGWINSW